MSVKYHDGKNWVVFPGTSGLPGKGAFQIAVENGYSGTREDFNEALANLTGVLENFASIDNEPILESKKLVYSGGVYNAINSTANSIVESIESTYATKEGVTNISNELNDSITNVSSELKTFKESTNTSVNSINSNITIINNKIEEIEGSIEDINNDSSQYVVKDNIKTVNGISLLGSGNVVTTVNSVEDHYKNDITSEGDGFVKSVGYDSAGHLTSIVKSGISLSDLPMISPDKIDGMIPIEKIPSGALERLFIVDDEVAAMSIDLELGDSVKLLNNNNVYICHNVEATVFEEKFTNYSSGIASSVDWSGVTNRPSIYPTDVDNVSGLSNSLDTINNSISDINNSLNNYLLKSGGTVTGNISIVNSENTETAYIHNEDGSFYGSDFQTSSDERYKTFHGNVEVDFDKLKTIPKVYYNWKDNKDISIGTSAQKLMEVYPELVSYDDQNDLYSVNYQKLAIVALAAIDKLNERLSILENKND